MQLSDSGILNESPFIHIKIKHGLNVQWSNSNPKLGTDSNDDSKMINFLSQQNYYTIFPKTISIFSNVFNKINGPKQSIPGLSDLHLKFIRNEHSHVWKRKVWNSFNQNSILK